MKYLAFLMITACGTQMVDVGDTTSFPTLVQDGYYYHIFLVDRDEARSDCSNSLIGREHIMVYRGMYDDPVYNCKEHHADFRHMGWKSADGLSYEASWNFFEPRVSGRMNIYETPLGLEGDIYLTNYECRVAYRLIGILKDLSTFSEDDH